jgi:hypothetical protein
MAHSEEAKRAHSAEYFAWNLAIALPLLGVRNSLALDKAADLLAQHPQLLGQVRLFRKMEFELG